MNTERKEKLLKCLAKIYLKYRNSDEGYFKVLQILKRLEYKGIFVDIKEVQQISYGNSCD